MILGETYCFYPSWSGTIRENIVMIGEIIGTTLCSLGPPANYSDMSTGWAFNYHSDWINTEALHLKLKHEFIHDLTHSLRSVGNVTGPRL